MIRIFVPCEAIARACGADDVATAIANEAFTRGLAVEILRTSSRGLFWLEPLVEVETPIGRMGYGPVTANSVADLFDANMPEGGIHELGLGLVEEIPFLKSQERLTFARAGITEPLSLEQYQAHGGFAGLKAALAQSGAATIQAVLDSGLRGRGGAGFPTGLKWQTVAGAIADQKYICCNADEGDSGTFADRLVMEGDPFMLIEGMTIAAIACGATKGYVYIRSEYPQAIEVMKEAVRRAEIAGFLGGSICGSDHSFELVIRVGAGAYICGEETAMLESLEGRRGVVRAKPPIPALKGLFGQPTIINNVLSFAAVPFILAQGAEAYKNYGMGRSRGTLPFQLAGNIARGGLVEKAFGVTLRDLVETYGGGTASGLPIRAIQVGGPLGPYVSAAQLDLPLDYEAFAAAGAMVGHGGIVVFDDSVDMAEQARFAMEFCAIESCGKCTPCRIGAVRGVETIDHIRAGVDVESNLALLNDLCQTMTDGSLCAMGGLTPGPVLSALKLFPEDFDRSADRVSAGQGDLT